AEAEAYWFWKNDANTVQPNNVKSHNTIHTFGGRGSADPIENWTVAGEVAFQVGDYVGFVNQNNGRARGAWALDVSTECRYFKENYAWKPVLGLEYIFYSGDKNPDPIPASNGTYNGWDVMYRGKDDSRIREFFGRYYWSAQGLRSLTANTTETTNPEDSSTNQHQLVVAGSLQPTDSLTFDAKYLAFWQAEERNYILSSGLNQKRGHYVGSEVDLQLTWDYTEDVSFGLVTAWFFPGDVYASGEDDVATDVVGTMKLSF
ncbi:MAG: alginate export family protein, partial [Candidatus Omnitrophota bacterium]